MKQNNNSLASLFSAIAASSLGNIIEWYDFALYLAVADILTHLFFPHDNPHVAIIKVFGIFAVGFLSRPVGSLIFGHFGDKIGRAKTLRLTILLITIPTLLTAFIPSYQQIGIFAPLLLMLLRLIQGISLGGEYSGNIAYLVEIAPNNHRALVASFAPVAANLGILISGLVTFVLTSSFTTISFTRIGWRLAFIIGALMSLAVFYLRRRFFETPTFLELQAQQQVLNAPVTTVFKTRYATMLMVMGLVLLGAIFYYLCFIYLGEYLERYAGVSHYFSLNLISICVSSMLLLVPIGGIICDKIGRRRSYFIVAGGVVLFSIIGFKLLLSHQFSYIIIAMIGFTLLSSLEQATTGVTVVEQFEPNIRYSGVSFCYNVTQALFGGTTPLFVAVLITWCNNLYMPAYYLTLAAVVTLTTAIMKLRS